MRNMILARLAALPRDTRGQDFIEYSLLAAFVATMGYALLPFFFDTAGPIRHIWGRITETLVRFGG